MKKNIKKKTKTKYVYAAVETKTTVMQTFHDPQMCSKFLDDQIMSRNIVPGTSRSYAMFRVGLK